MALTQFFSKIAGVSYPNTDGSSRQAALRGCGAGERLRLVREPDNPYDDEAVAVFRATGEQLGYVTERANNEVSVWLDDGVRVEAFLTYLTGGGPGQDLGANLLIIAAEGGEGEAEIVACAREQLAADWADRRQRAAEAEVDPAWSPQAVEARLPQYRRPEERLDLGAARVAAILAAPPDAISSAPETGTLGSTWWWPWGAILIVGVIVTVVAFTLWLMWSWRK